MEENVSYEVRRQRARKMHSMAHRLQQMKKVKALSHASEAVLKKRAGHLARALLRKKVAGLQGQHYASLTTAAKIAIDKLVDKIPKHKLKGLSKRLIHVARKAETARLASAKDNSKKSKVAEEFNEAHVSHRQRSHRKAAAERSAHKRKTGSGHDSNKHREGTGLGRSLNKVARSEVLKQMGGKLTGREMSDAAIRAMLIDRPDRTKQIKSRSSRRKSEKRGSRADHSRRSTRGNKYSHDRRGGHGSIRSDYDHDIALGMMIAEGSNNFQDLFIRGLVSKNKVEQYKRIFSNLDENIKLRRYQNDIARILEELVEIITEDDVIYRRVRLGLQTKKWKQ